MSDTPIIALRGISKSYAGIRALEAVDFAAHRGSVHAILGENGAGKSTLIKIISGVVQPDAGEMRLHGHPVRFASPSAATEKGVVCMFQELSLIPDLSVADNLCIAAPPRRMGLIDRKAQLRRAEELLARV
ncbi:MAG: ATP-binding cassette domain-containing protein, partial [Tabrizicola sp.]